MVSLLVLAQTRVVGVNVQTPADVSYLADNILVLRYFEAQGEVKQAVSMIKKRSGAHEHTIRELRLGPETIRVGEPLTNFPWSTERHSRAYRTTERTRTSAR